MAIGLGFDLNEYSLPLIHVSTYTGEEFRKGGEIPVLSGPAQKSAGSVPHQCDLPFHDQYIRLFQRAHQFDPQFSKETARCLGTI
jgi:hypothetical protein